MFRALETTRDVGSNDHETFEQVTDWLYRGGDPTKRLMPLMKDADIRTVISLRHRESIQRAEREFLAPEGIDLIQIPMTYFSMSEEDIDLAVHAIDAAKANVFVHCDHGKDRTGIVIAAHRVVHQGWRYSDARHELLYMGFHKFRFFLMEHTLQQYLRRQGKLV